MKKLFLLLGFFAILMFACKKEEVKQKNDCLLETYLAYHHQLEDIYKPWMGENGPVVDVTPEITALTKNEDESFTACVKAGVVVPMGPVKVCTYCQCNACGQSWAPYNTGCGNGYQGYCYYETCPRCSGHNISQKSTNCPSSYCSGIGK